MITTPVVLMILLGYHACGVDAPPWLVGVPPWLPRLWCVCSSLVTGGYCSLITILVVWTFLVGYHACGEHLSGLLVTRPMM